MYNFNYGMGLGGLNWIRPFGPALILLALWSIFWKGLALWHSGRREQEWWFVILLLVNTAGILDIIYLFLVIKMKASELFTKK
ncbi:MAG: DUF5652 family protein [Candidatus Pacebacteria bacterium]|nr:DUF5652 family protein [Candidatus Paceibacterota bacterium]MDD5357062.1 DUF5652 family protein [Candidatus Paceibacterota bacterium]